MKLKITLLLTRELEVHAGHEKEFTAEELQKQFDDDPYEIVDFMLDPDVKAEFTSEEIK